MRDAGYDDVERVVRTGRCPACSCLKISIFPKSRAGENTRKIPLLRNRGAESLHENRLTAYAAAHPGECRQTDADPDTGYMEFEIRKGRFSFRPTAPYSAERRWAASEAAKKRIKGF